MADQKLAHFEIHEKIGAGGMGEVYRARDTKLGREVALKVLPEALAQDPERIARFQREAQLLASLNHTNIASIYGLEEAGDKRVLVMELAEGEDMSRRLERGSLPLEDALEVAHQIAVALEEAHDKGIVHRDLKPANVNVTSQNKVKVLDFGLAKAFEESPAESGINLSQSPTITGAMTGANVILGTAAYMSPEQAKGKGADRRSDIWAFGIVLFEMLTGKMVFEGETISETLASVMKDEVPWDRLSGSTPAAIRRLLERCLERDPRNRLQAIGEARIAIEVVQKGEDAAPQGGAEDGVPNGAAGPKRRIVSFIPWVITAVAVGLAVVFMTTRPSIAPEDSPTRRFWLDVSLDENYRRPYQISPDGTRIAFSSNNSLWLRDLSELEPRVLVEIDEVGPDEGASVPFWSPDSRYIGYAAMGKLWKVLADGGAPTAICNLGDGFVGGAWFPEDRIVYSVARGDMFEVSARGGDPRVILARDLPHDIDYHDPFPLPGGGVIYSLHRTEGVDTIELLENGERKVLLRLETGNLVGSPQVVNFPVYSATGHLLYRRDQGNLGVWAVPFSLASRSVTGDPFLVAPHGRAPSVSDDGTLVYMPSPEAGPGEMVWINRDGEVEGTVGGPARGLTQPVISPDGTRVVFLQDDGDASEVWVHDLVRGSRTRLTFSAEDEASPTWWPGRDMVAFSSENDSGRVIAARAADGTGEMEILIQGGSTPAFSPDGRFMAYQQMVGVVGDLVVKDFSGDLDPQIFVSAGSGFYEPQFSADGRYISYMSWESGNPTTYIRPADGGPGKWELPESWESRVIWTDSEIFYSVNRVGSQLYSIPVQTTPTLVLGTPKELFDLGALNVDPFNLISMSPDAKRFLMIRRLETEEIRGGIVVVENWVKEFEDTFSETSAP